MVEIEIKDQLNKIFEEAREVLYESPKLGIEKLSKAYIISIKENLLLEKGKALIMMASAFTVMSLYSKSMKCSYKALRIFNEINNKEGIGKAYNTIGIMNYYFGELEETVKYFRKSLKIFEEIEHEYMISCLKNNIGEVCKNLKDYKEAQKYYSEALIIAEKLDKQDDIVAILCNIGDVLLETNQVEKAAQNYFNSYKILEENKCSDQVLISLTEKKIGDYYNKKDEKLKAKEYYFLALERLYKVENTFYPIDILVELAEIEQDEDNNKKIEYYQKALQYAEDDNLKYKMKELYKKISDYYEEIQNYEQAFLYFKKFHSINMEIEVATVTFKLQVMREDILGIDNIDDIIETKKINKVLEKEINKEKQKGLELQKVNRTLRFKNSRDELTGIYNRRKLFEYLEEVFKEANSELSIGLFVIDIDRFKQFNDTHGHIKGDECLVDVTGIVSNLRFENKTFFARYGGEEFVYMIEDANCEEIQKIGEKLVKEVSANSCSNVTISVGGVFGKVKDFIDVEDALKKADTELYRAKDFGRNKFCLKQVKDSGNPLT